MCSTVNFKEGRISFLHSDGVHGLEGVGGAPARVQKARVEGEIGSGECCWFHPTPFWTSGLRVPVASAGWRGGVGGGEPNEQGLDSIMEIGFSGDFSGELVDFSGELVGVAVLFPAASDLRESHAT
jgi:hypothetical protein